MATIRGVHGSIDFVKHSISHGHEPLLKVLYSMEIGTQKLIPNETLVQHV